MKNYIAPINSYLKNGKLTLDTYGCYLGKEYNHKCNHPYEMDNVYLLPTKKAIKDFGIVNLHVTVLIGLDKPTKSKSSRWKWSYKAKKAVLIPYLDFLKVVGDVPTLNSFPMPTGWNVFGKVIVPES
jgi:hypothetical protein